MNSSAYKSVVDNMRILRHY